MGIYKYKLVDYILSEGHVIPNVLFLVIFFYEYIYVVVFNGDTLVKILGYI